MSVCSSPPPSTDASLASFAEGRSSPLGGASAACEADDLTGEWIELFGGSGGARGEETAVGALSLWQDGTHIRGSHTSTEGGGPTGECSVEGTVQGDDVRWSFVEWGTSFAGTFDPDHGHIKGECVRHRDGDAWVVRFQRKRALQITPVAPSADPPAWAAPAPASPDTPPDTGPPAAPPSPSASSARSLRLTGVQSRYRLPRRPSLPPGGAADAEVPRRATTPRHSASRATSASARRGGTATATPTAPNPLPSRTASPRTGGGSAAARRGTSRSRTPRAAASRAGSATPSFLKGVGSRVGAQKQPPATSVAPRTPRRGGSAAPPPGSPGPAVGVAAEGVSRSGVVVSDVGGMPLFLSRRAAEAGQQQQHQGRRHVGGSSPPRSSALSGSPAPTSSRAARSPSPPGSSVQLGRLASASLHNARGVLPTHLEAAEVLALQAYRAATAARRLRACKRMQSEQAVKQLRMASALAKATSEEALQLELLREEHGRREVLGRQVVGMPDSVTAEMRRLRLAWAQLGGAVLEAMAPVAVGGVEVEPAALGASLEDGRAALSGVMQHASSAEHTPHLLSKFAQLSGLLEETQAEVDRLSGFVRSGILLQNVSAKADVMQRREVAGALCP